MTTKFEKQKIAEGYTCVIGCDEVGRGSLAGPVVAAAVMLPHIQDSKFKFQNFRGVKDSKLLSPSQREKLSVIIQQDFKWGIGEVSAEMIDEINIHNATLLAMRRAVESLLGSISSAAKKSLSVSSETNTATSFLTSAQISQLAQGEKNKEKYFLYLDGKFLIPEFHLKQQAVIGGDNKIFSVAAASIVAKVYRDQLMKNFHSQYPLYNFPQHKGYATLHHRTMIKRHGLSAIHRKSFCNGLW